MLAHSKDSRLQYGKNDLSVFLALALRNFLREANDLNALRGRSLETSITHTGTVSVNSFSKTWCEGHVTESHSEIMCLSVHISITSTRQSQNCCHDSHGQWRQSHMNVNNCPTRCDYIQFYYISADSSTCFGWYPHPSSGAHSNCNYNIWHWSNRTCYRPLTRRSRN